VIVNLAPGKVHRFGGRPDAHPCSQAGYLGLMKAIGNFGPSSGRSLVAYAEPGITGELRRHLAGVARGLSGWE
jgi:DNA-directed RNA polymerase specialized sigma subunit